MRAIQRVLARPATRTRDLGGVATTESCGRALVEALND